jgi:hypothetical protein
LSALHRIAPRTPLKCPHHSNAPPKTTASTGAASGTKNEEGKDAQHNDRIRRIETDFATKAKVNADEADKIDRENSENIPAIRKNAA